MLTMTPTTSATRTTSGRKAYSCTGAPVAATPTLAVRSSTASPDGPTRLSRGVTRGRQLRVVVGAALLGEVLQQQLRLGGVDVDHPDQDALVALHEAGDHVEDLVQRRLHRLAQVVDACRRVALGDHRGRDRVLVGPER